MAGDKQIEIYQGEDGQTEIEVTLEGETVWLTQSQMAELFGRDQSVVSRHIRNALKDGELAEQSNMQKTHIAHSDRPVIFYDLDVVISVGYRIKSSQGVQFRRWATQRLKEYMVRGYALNQTRFEKNAAELGELKQQLMSRGEATALFAQVREAGLPGIFVNLDQSVAAEA